MKRVFKYFSLVLLGMAIGFGLMMWLQASSDRRRAAPRIVLTQIEGENKLRIASSKEHSTVSKPSKPLQVKFEFISKTSFDFPPNDRSGYEVKYKLYSTDPKVPLAFLVPIESQVTDDESYWYSPQEFNATVVSASLDWKVVSARRGRIEIWKDDKIQDDPSISGWLSWNKITTPLPLAEPVHSKLRLFPIGEPIYSIEIDFLMYPMGED